MIHWQGLNAAVLNVTTLILLCELVALIYMNVINGEFIFDDMAIAENTIKEIRKRERRLNA